MRKHKREIRRCRVGKSVFGCNDGLVLAPTSRGRPVGRRCSLLRWGAAALIVLAAAAACSGGDPESASRAGATVVAEPTPTATATEGTPEATPEATQAPLPTPDTSGRAVGAAALREARPVSTPRPVSEQTQDETPTPEVSVDATPAADTAPDPTPVPAEDTGSADAGSEETAPSTPDPQPADAPTPVGEPGLGALRTPTGVIAGIVGGSEGAWEIVSPCNNVVTVASGEVLDRPVVLIDPGHGGSETGAVGPGGLTEKELNLVVAEQLQAWLDERGITSALTRERDYRMALRARTALANAWRPTMLVSIHHNGGSIQDLDTAPTEVFYQEFSEDSMRLAGLVYESLEVAMTPMADSWRGTPFEGAQPRFTPSGETLYGILRRSEVPAVITEAFYLDNAHGEGLANDPAVLEIETDALGRAIERYLTTADPGSGFVEGQQFTLGNSSGGTDGCTDPTLE